MLEEPEFSARILGPRSAEASSICSEIGTEMSVRSSWILVCGACVTTGVIEGTPDI